MFLFDDALNTFHLQLYGVGHVVKDPHLMNKNVLFNDVLNTFHLWLYGVGHFVKDRYLMHKN